MFSLHERTQRKFCRTAFVLVCALPTLIILCWVAYFHRPWQERDWQQAFESELHVNVEVGEVSAPRPWRRSLEYVSLSDLHSKWPLIEFHNLQVGPADSICVETAIVSCNHLQTLARAAQIWLAGESIRNSQWQFKELNFTNTEGAQWGLQDVRCEIKAFPDGVRQCLAHARRDNKLIRLSIERSTDGKIQMLVDAQQVAVPAWVLAETLPGANSWQTAPVTGVIHWEAEHSEVRGYLRGHVNSIDTQAWIGNDLLHARTTLQLESFTWRNGRLESAQGSLQASTGTVSSALLLLLKEKFLCTLAVEESQLNEKSQLHQIDELGCQFQLNEAGLTVTGMFAWGETSKGCIITSAGKPFVSNPAIPTLPLAQLVQLVNPHNPYWVPATREAISLGEKLPLPESTTQKK
jgi:hypothetical protein